MTGLWVGAAVLVAVTVVLNRASLKVLRPVARPPDRTVPETGVAHEDLTIESGDHELGAWLLCPEHRTREPLVLLAHGWGANYSLLLQLAEPLVEHGFEVLLFDVQGHGRNEPVPFVTVRHFRDDILAAAAYANERYPGRSLVVVGHSLGGAAAVLAAAEGARVDGLVLIASPSDVVRVTAEYFSDNGLPGGLMANLFRPFWWFRAGSRFARLTPTRRLPELDLPLLIIQPENDRRVSRGHAERLADAARQEYHLVGDATHNDVLGNPEVVGLVRDFLEQF